MARDEYIHHQLLNWARWKAGACMGGLGYSRSHFGDVVDESGYRESVIPTIALDAEQMDRAVATLDADLQATIEAVYVHAMPWQKSADRLHVALATVKERTWRAHRKLAVALVDVKAKAAAVRARVEAVQRGARPTAG